MVRRIYINTAQPPRSSGVQAIVGASIAVIGALAAANPGSAVLQALDTAGPPLAQAVPAVITAVGAIIAAFSSPPRLGKR